jgi:RND family efflux transporter MFP subunit
MRGGNGWTARQGGLLGGGVSRLRGGLPNWVLKWGLSLLFIFLIFKGYHVAVGLLQAPQLEMKQAMFPSGLSGAVGVSAQAAARRDLVRTVTYPGTVAPDQDVPVYARVEGWVLSIGPREGDVVRAGQVLARLDTTQLAPQVQQDEFAVAAARAAYGQHQVAISEAESNYERQKTAIAQAKADLADAQAKESYAASEFERDKALYQAGGISGSEFDQARQTYASAQARVAAAREQIAAQEAATQAARQQITERVKMSEAMADQVRAQQAGLAQMQSTLGYAVVVAPQSGVVTARLVDTGVLVKPGQPLLKMAKMDTVRVRSQVAQEDAAVVRVGTPAVIRFEGLSSPVRARVTRVFPQDDPQTRTTTVEMLIPNAGGRIKLDMYASVDLDLAVHKNAVVIPRAAVLPDENGKPVVFVADGNYARARPVTEGLTQDDWVEITRGVKPGEMVITDGNRGLVDGQEIVVTNF